jgi:hypothetical protein
MPAWAGPDRTIRVNMLWTCDKKGKGISFIVHVCLYVCLQRTYEKKCRAPPQPVIRRKERRRNRPSSVSTLEVEGLLGPGPVRHAVRE